MWCVSWALCFDRYIASLREGYRVLGRPARQASEGPWESASLKSGGGVWEAT